MLGQGEESLSVIHVAQVLWFDNNTFLLQYKAFYSAVTNWSYQMAVKAEYIASTRSAHVAWHYGILLKNGWQ